MARTIFFNIPAHGHINPTLPVVARLTAAGEQVVYFAADEFAPKITAVGAEYRPLPRLNIDYANPPENVTVMAGVLIDYCVQTLPELLDFTRQQQPDYLIFDTLSSIGWYVAKILALPSICSTSTFSFAHVNPVAFSGSPWQLAGMVFSGLPSVMKVQRAHRLLAQQYGVDGRSFIDSFVNRADLNLVYTSRDFQPNGDVFGDDFAFVGPTIPASQPVGDFPIDQLNGRSVIYISLGTLFNNRPDFFRTCQQAFADLDVVIVMSVGRKIDIAGLGGLPTNAIVRPFVPQVEILKHASLFLTHGGMNSVHEGLYHNVPLLVYPQMSEQKMVAHRVADSGAGLLLTDDDIQPLRLRQLAESVLGNPTYQQATARLGAGLRAAGGADRAVAEIQGFKQRRGILT